MGNFEVFLGILSILLLAFVVYTIITVLPLKDLLRRFSPLKNARRDFYECGFKPQTQRPIKVSIQFLIICIFFILYDIELIFLVPFISGVSFTAFYDLFLLGFFFLFFFITLLFDYDRQVITWQS